MKPFDFVLLALAVFRVANDIANMDGPFDLYTRVRGWVLERFGPDSWQNQGVNCPICISWWFTPVILVLFRFRVGRKIVEGLAVAGVTSVITGITD